MLKPLTLSVSLAVALGACGVSMAGNLGDGCVLCGLASPQCAKPSAQCATPSPQCNLCAKTKSCLSGLKSLCTPKPKTYCYEWVLKKRRCGGLFGHGGGCSICGGS